MAKNYMNNIAKMLGVEIGEKFIIENAVHKETVVLTIDGFYVVQPNNMVDLTTTNYLARFCRDIMRL